MINHARTLLMNVDGDGDYPDYLCHEVVHPDYRAVALPQPLRAVRRVLFGTDPDKPMLAVRCRQLLALAEGTPLFDYLRAFDRRVTYDFSKEPLVLPDGYAVGTAGGDGIRVHGMPPPPDSTGRMCYRVAVSTPADGQVEVRQLAGRIQKTVFTFTAGQPVGLIPNMTFALDSAAAGQHYQVTVVARPAADLGALVDRAAALGEPTRLALFGVDTAEPYKTFGNLWASKRELPLRLGALVCALVYRTEQVRLGG